MFNVKLMYGAKRQKFKQEQQPSYNETSMPHESNFRADRKAKMEVKALTRWRQNEMRELTHKLYEHV